jgi:hypothetical protein
MKTPRGLTRASVDKKSIFCGHIDKTPSGLTKRQLTAAAIVKWAGKGIYDLI